MRAGSIQHHGDVVGDVIQAVGQDAQGDGNGAGQVALREVAVAAHVDDLQGHIGIDAGFQFINAGEFDGNVLSNLLLCKLRVVAGVRRGGRRAGESEQEEAAGKVSDYGINVASPQLKSLRGFHVRRWKGRRRCGKRGMIGG